MSKIEKGEGKRSPRECPEPTKARALPSELTTPDKRGAVIETVADQNEKAKSLLTPDEFWAGLQKVIGRGSLYSLIQAGRIKHIRVGRKILIPRSELTEFPLREANAARKNHGRTERGKGAGAPLIKG